MLHKEGVWYVGETGFQMRSSSVKDGSKVYTGGGYCVDKEERVDRMSHVCSPYSSLQFYTSTNVRTKMT